MHVSLSVFVVFCGDEKNSTLAYSGVCIYHVRYVKAKVIWYLLLLIPRMLKMNECKDKPMFSLKSTFMCIVWLSAKNAQKMLKKCL